MTPRYAVLELAVMNIMLEDSLTIQVKKMLQKCAHTMLSCQEMPAQFVATFLMDYEDHFILQAVLYQF